MSLPLWLATLAVAAASDSILEMMDTHQVERLMAERRRNSSRDSAFERNLLEDEDVEDYNAEPQLRKNMSEELQELLVRNGGKILHSSKEALLVTKKQYLRKDWCRTEPLVQEVREEGCAPASVLNNFCYGQCNSFYIPRGFRRKAKASHGDVEPASFKSCAFCRPKRSSWVTVTLRCRKKKRVVMRRKQVLRVKECKCLAEPVD